MRWIKPSLTSSFYSFMGYAAIVPKSVRAERTENIREAMLDALGPGNSAECVQIRRRIRFARDIEGLWYLRGELMAALATLQGEAAARQKIDSLSTLFQGLLPGGLGSRPSPLVHHP